MGRWALVALPATLAAFVMAAIGVAGGTLWPWDPRLPDFEVYRRTGALVLAGGDFQHADGLGWLYPPFAALLSVPLAVPSWPVATALWVLLSVACLLAIGYRLGVSGWRLSLLSAAAVVFMMPVGRTIAFGQLGLLLVAAAVLDSMPGPRVFRRRILPEGSLVGLGAAVKLTPAVIAVHNYLIGRRKPSWVSAVTFVVASAIGLAVFWGPSIAYWFGMVGGGVVSLGGTVYGANQSVPALWTRLTGTSSYTGLLLSALVLALGLWASALMHRCGQPRLALVLAGVAGLLASPISWSHHYVWVLPLAVILWQEHRLPASWRWPTMLYALWVMAAPFMYLPMGGGVELTYSWVESVIDNAGIVAGVLVLAGAVAISLGPWGKRARSISPE